MKAKLSQWPTIIFLGSMLVNRLAEKDKSCIGASKRSRSDIPAAAIQINSEGDSNDKKKTSKLL